MPELGTQFAGYRIDDVVGRGGMGVVYRATELALDRPVALKLIAPELAGDASFRERFLRESRLAASIDHAGILPVYPAGEADGELYLANRFVEGTDLRALVEQGPLPPERALGLVGQVADALDAAHARGLVHRDVKPGNVLVDAADHCYLSDFGLTKQLGRRGRDRVRAAGGIARLPRSGADPPRRGGRPEQTSTPSPACSTSCSPELRRSGARRKPRRSGRTCRRSRPRSRPTPSSNRSLHAPSRRSRRERYESCDAFVDDARAALGLGPSPVAVRRRRRRIGGRLLYGGCRLDQLSPSSPSFSSSHAARARRSSLRPTPSGSSTLSPRSSCRRSPSGTRRPRSPPRTNGCGCSTRTTARGRSPASTPRRRLACRRSRSEGRRGTSCPRSARSGSGRPRAGSFASSRAPISSKTSWTLPNAGEESAFDLDQGAGWLAAGRTRSGPAASERSPASIRRPRRWNRGRSAFWGPMAYGFGSLWVLGPELARLSPATMRRVATVELPGGSSDIATGLGAVWVADDEGEAVLRVDPREEGISRTLRRRRSGPLGVAVGADAVWAASEAGTVARIDPRTDEVTDDPRRRNTPHARRGSGRGLGLRQVS